MANQNKDPVCGMTVDPAQTKHKIEHQGKQYTFCCEDCLTKFKLNPNMFSSKQ